MHRSVHGGCSQRVYPTSLLHPSLRPHRPHARRTLARTARWRRPRNRTRATPRKPCRRVRRRSSQAHPAGSSPCRRGRARVSPRAHQRRRTRRLWRRDRSARARSTSPALAPPRGGPPVPDAVRLPCHGRRARRFRTAGGRGGSRILRRLRRHSSRGVVGRDLLPVARLRVVVFVEFGRTLDLVLRPRQVHHLLVAVDALDQPGGDQDLLAEDPPTSIDHEVAGVHLEARVVHGANVPVQRLDVVARDVEPTHAVRICPELVVHRSTGTSSSRPKNERYLIKTIRRSSVVTSSPRSHCASSRARCSEKLETRRSIRSETKAFASCTDPRGSSTNCA